MVSRNRATPEGERSNPRKFSGWYRRMRPYACTRHAAHNVLTGHRVESTLRFPRHVLWRRCLLHLLHHLLLWLLCPSGNNNNGLVVELLSTHSRVSHLVLNQMKKAKSARKKSIDMSMYHHMSTSRHDQKIYKGPVNTHHRDLRGGNVHMARGLLTVPVNRLRWDER